MSGFNLGGVFGGLTHGIERGLQIDAQFLSSFVWCIEHAQVDALNELVTIAKQNIGEVLDTSGNVLPTVVSGLIAGSDPFAGSRHAFQGWQAKHGVH